MSVLVVDLVEKAKRGNHKAFEELIRATYADTYTLAFRLTGDEEDARDVVQESYIRAQKGLKRFRAESKFSTWLYRITANCAATYSARANKHRHDSLAEDAPIVDESLHRDPSHQADLGDLRRDLKQALASLPPKLRAVVVLKDIYDLSHESIAEELDISESAAKVRLHRARQHLREMLYDSSSEVQAHAV